MAYSPMVFRGLPNGLAPLDGEGQVPAAMLGNQAVEHLFHKHLAGGSGGDGNFDELLHSFPADSFADDDLLVIDVFRRATHNAFGSSGLTISINNSGIFVLMPDVSTSALPTIYATRVLVNQPNIPSGGEVIARSSAWRSAPLEGNSWPNIEMLPNRSISDPMALSLFHAQDPGQDDIDYAVHAHVIRGSAQ